MASNIILNKNNIANKSNNYLVYNFPSTVEFKKGDTIAVNHLNLYYSWFNITSKYNNNFFQYKWWDENGDLVNIHDITIQDGFYSVQTLNEYLISIMKNRGHYLELIDSGNPVFFIEFLRNSSYYSVQIKLSSLSDFVDMGSGLVASSSIFKSPVGWTYPSTFETPELIIPSNNNFYKLLGFSPKTLSGDTTGDVINSQYSFLNDIPPVMLPSSSFIITCNMVSNELSNPNNILYSFTIPNDVGFEMMINPSSDVIYSKIKEGRYDKIELKIYDQNFIPLDIIDEDMLIVLSIVKQE